MPDTGGEIARNFSRLISALVAEETDDCERQHLKIQHRRPVPEIVQIVIYARLGIIKRVFGFQKVRYRGLAKNLH